MIIEQFYDKGLAHASYVLINDGEAVVIDPARDPEQYVRFVAGHGAMLKAIIETHPHADFVSGHLELHALTGAPIYLSKLVGPSFDYKGFDDGDIIQLGDVSLHAMNTPGHSPDSISIVLHDHRGKAVSVFTGDTLFIGDVGRPDLRESVGNLQAKKEELAEQMYHSLRDKLMHLPDDCIVYPAHGAGSLCGKNLSSETSGTIGNEKKHNYAMQEMDKASFVKMLTEDQPFMPKYFAFNVELNKQGAPNFRDSINDVEWVDASEIDRKRVIIDTRSAEDFRSGHIKGAINLMNGLKFETWLGSVVGPNEKFYLIVSEEDQMQEFLEKIAKIGYEKNMLGVSTCPNSTLSQSEEINLTHFEADFSKFTIVDIRNNGELADVGAIFPNAIHIPLPELRERVSEVPDTKSIVVHCAGGYRSAAGLSILSTSHKSKVYDLSTAISDFQKKNLVSN